MILVSHAQSGKAPRVLQIGINRKAVVFLGQGSAVREDFNCASEVVGDGVLEFLSPTRRVRRKSLAGGKANGGHVKAGVKASPAVKADFLRIEFVEIVEDAADGEAFVVIQLLVENAERNSAGVA